MIQERLTSKTGLNLHQTIQEYNTQETQNPKTRLLEITA